MVYYDHSFVFDSAAVSRLFARQLKRGIVPLLMLAILALVAVFAWDVVSVQAKTTTTDFGTQALDENLQLSGDDIRVVIARIINTVLGLLGIIAVALILYAGYVIMTSGGVEEKVATGRKIMINAVIGLIIILASFGIVRFVLNALSDATGLGGNLEKTGGQQLETFVGSGSLGRIVQDHYPMRNQVDVKRNTQIAVTFAEAIDTTSLILDTNNSATFGDCVDPEGGEPFSWATHCDQLNTSSVKIYQTDNPDVVVNAAALTTYNQEGEAFTFSFKPLAYLGSDTEDVSYTVELLGSGTVGAEPGIQKQNGDDAFGSDVDGFYAWQFETGTEIDLTPPHVVDVFPSAAEPRNAIPQITFNEAVDPIVLQGYLNQLNEEGPTHALFDVVGEVPAKTQVVSRELTPTTAQTTVSANEEDVVSLFDSETSTIWTSDPGIQMHYIHLTFDEPQTITDVDVTWIDDVDTGRCSALGFVADMSPEEVGTLVNTTGIEQINTLEDAQTFRYTLASQVTAEQFAVFCGSSTSAGNFGMADMSLIVEGEEQVTPEVLPSGEWRISNGYRTLEFISDQQCGQNSCGGELYCLPVSCEDESDPSCENTYTIMLETAQLVNPSGNSFVARPLTGVVDMAGNALNGNKNDVAEGQPSRGDEYTLEEIQEEPDNHYWDFTIKNEIDRRAPYVHDMTPNIDTQGVRGEAPIAMTFSKRMFSGSLYNIGLEEHDPGGASTVRSIWFRPRPINKSLSLNGNLVTTTEVMIDHRELGPNEQDYYYFASAGKDVKDAYGNCLYPGRGPYASGGSPGQETACTVTYNEDDGSVDVVGPGCAPGKNDVTSSTDATCAAYVNMADAGADAYLQPDVDACLNVLRGANVSPAFPEETEE